VNLDPGSESGTSEKHPKLAQLVRRMIQLTNDLDFPVTWAVSDPAFSAATPLILRSETCHELAILGDANWVGPTAGRTRFARELARRVSQARAARINVRTLVPRVESVVRHLDLVIKQRISAISGVERPTLPNRGSSSPRALHYGVWEVPVCETLPLRPRWWFSGKRSLFGQIRAEARTGGAFHLEVDTSAMVREGRAALSVFEWLVQHVAELRKRGMISVETLGQAAERLSTVPAASPQHSILRQAA
jgi:hypothetical protein